MVYVDSTGGFLLDRLCDAIDRCSAHGNQQIPVSDARVIRDSVESSRVGAATSLLERMRYVRVHTLLQLLCLLHQWNMTSLDVRTCHRNLYLLYFSDNCM